MLAHLLRRATADTFRARLSGLDLSGLQERVEASGPVETGELVPGSALLASLGTIPGLAAMLSRLGGEGSESPGAGRKRRRVRDGGLAPASPPRQGRAARPDGLRVTSFGGVGGYRYGPWDGGPDPLASAVRRGGRPRRDGRVGPRGVDAARERSNRCCAAGAQGRRGLDDLRRQIEKRRREARERGRLDGTLEQVRELLDKALDQERAALFPDPSDDARLAEAELDTLPNDPARAVRALSEYDWRSPEARETFEQIQDLLRREVLDSQFKGMKQALRKRHARGHAAGQGHARRPQLDARGRRPRRRHRPDVPGLHGQARRLLPGEPAEPGGAGRLAGPPGRRGREAHAQPDPRAAPGAGRPDGDRDGRPRPAGRDVAAAVRAAVGPARPGLGSGPAPAR